MGAGVTLLGATLFCFFWNEALAGQGGSKDVFLCADGVERLGDVFSQYGPLCDGRPDCGDGSDEAHCGGGASTKGGKAYTGCWSHRKSAGGLVTNSISACDRCLCTADVADCSRLEFLGQDCGTCVTDEDLVGDGRPDCIHGVDESDDAVVLKNKFGGPSGDRWRHIMGESVWRCRDPLYNDVVKQCGAVLREHRRPFLYAFSSGEMTSEECDDLFGDDRREVFTFWKCRIGQCVRDRNHCQGQCPQGYDFDQYAGNCRRLQCPQGTWQCDNGCIPQSVSCHGRCSDRNKYFCHEDGSCKDPRIPCGQYKSCPPLRHYCSRSRICQSDTLTCGYRTCLGKDHAFCYSADSCLPAGQWCRQWCPEGERKCGGTCVKMDEDCDGQCAAGRFACLTETSLICKEMHDACNGSCHPNYELCRDRLGKTVCLPWGQCPFEKPRDVTYFPVAPTTTVTTTIKATTTTTTTITTIRTAAITTAPEVDFGQRRGWKKRVSTCEEQTCVPESCPAPPCLETCLWLNQTCNGRCLEGRAECAAGVCLERDSDEYKLCDNGEKNAHAGTSWFRWKGDYVHYFFATAAACASLALAASFCYCLCRMNRRSKKVGNRYDQRRKAGGGGDGGGGPRVGAAAASSAGAPTTGLENSNYDLVEIQEENQYYREGAKLKQQQQLDEGGGGGGSGGMSTFEDDFEITEHNGYYYG